MDIKTISYANKLLEKIKACDDFSSWLKKLDESSCNEIPVDVLEAIKPIKSDLIIKTISIKSSLENEFYSL